MIDMRFAAKITTSFISMHGYSILCLHVGADVRAGPLSDAFESVKATYWRCALHSIGCMGRRYLLSSAATVRASGHADSTAGVMNGQRCVLRKYAACSVKASICGSCFRKKGTRAAAEARARSIQRPSFFGSFH
jgi:hypothetical protein